MTPIYLDQFPPFSIVERERDHNQTRLPLSTQARDTSFSCLISYNNPEDQQAIYRDDHYHHQQQQKHQQQEPNEPIPTYGASNHPLPLPTANKDDNNGVERSLSDRCMRTEDAHGTAKWMSSKMRFMRKMMGAGHITRGKPKRSMQAPQDQQETSQDSRSCNTSDYPAGIIRVCSDCNTTKTPLWRSGPRGPKSLCNACGIRQRKARRAMAAAAVSSGLIAAKTPTVVTKEKRSSDEDRTLPYKKRCQATASKNAEKKLFFDDITIKLSQSSAFYGVFPQDERDAAILLMALSCGLIHG